VRQGDRRDRVFNAVGLDWRLDSPVKDMLTGRWLYFLAV